MSFHYNLNSGFVANVYDLDLFFLMQYDICSSYYADTFSGFTCMDFLSYELFQVYI